MIRTLIVDDYRSFRMSLQTILEAQDDVEVCALGADGDEAVELFERERPYVSLMDIQMPGSDGLGAAERILGAHKHARIVFLTTFSDDEYIVRALRLGAKGYLIKQEVATIAPALRTVMAGQSVLGGEVLDRMDVLMSRGPACAENARWLARCAAASPSANLPSWSWWPRVSITRRSPPGCTSARARCATTSAPSSRSSI